MDDVIQSRFAKAMLPVLVAAIVGATGCQRGTHISLQAQKAAPDVIPDSQLTENQLSDIHVSMAQAMEDRGDLGGAIAAWERLADREPTAMLPSWRLGVLSARMGKTEQADASFRRALALDPQNAELQADYAYFLYLGHRWAEAEEHLQAALRKEPQNARLHNNLALLLAQTERRAEAVAEFTRAGCPEDEIEANLALIAALQGDTATASRGYQSALSLNPLSERAREGHAAVNAVMRGSDSLIRPAGYERTSEPQPQRYAPANRGRTPVLDAASVAEELPVFDDPATIGI
jgi:Flp pilus assembly protein TadD